jgi:hypothetical protein
MRKIFLILASVFTTLSIVFAFLPLGTLGLIPIVIALLFGYLAFQKSDDSQKKLVKVLLLFSTLSLIAVIGKEVLVQDEIAKDAVFEKEKIETKKESQKELEELEGLE